jgi:hypothetical protein
LLKINCKFGGRLTSSTSSALFNGGLELAEPFRIGISELLDVIATRNGEYNIVAIKDKVKYRKI